MDDMAAQGRPDHDRCRYEFGPLELAAYLAGIVLSFALDAIVDNWVSVWLYHL